MKYLCKRCVLVLQLGSTTADDCNSFVVCLECDYIFIVLQRNCKLKRILVKTTDEAKVLLLIAIELKKAII